MAKISRFRKSVALLGVFFGSTTVLPLHTNSASAATTSVPKASFSKCAATLQCATVKVPLDPSDPSGSKISIHVTRRKAPKKTQRIGVLIVNPGGPGASTSSILKDAERFVSPAILERFDLVGVDPRGTIKSTKIGCAVPAVPISQATDLVSRNDVAKVRDLYAKVAASCFKSGKKILPHINTTTNAHDLEVVRKALGEKQLSFFGMSYGTYVGAVYQSLFPERTRSMVLDSALDPTRFGVNQLLDPVAAAEVALDDFLAACGDGSLNPCAFNDGTDLKERFLAVRKKAADLKPEMEAGITTFDLGVASLVGYRRAGWPKLAVALADVASDREPNFSLSLDGAEPVAAEDRAPIGGFSSGTNIATNCRDGILPLDDSAFEEVLGALPTVGPRFAGTSGSFGSVLTCIDWPLGPVPQTTLTPTAVPILVIGNRWDLTTPITWSKSVASQVNASFVQRNGGGHVASDKSACIRDITAKFLIDAEIPAIDTSCSYND